MKIGESPFLHKGIQPSASGRSAGGDRPGLPVPLAFGQGQLVRGEVKGLNQEGEFLLESGGQIFAARSEVELKPGSALWFEVQETEPLWLRVADKKGSAQELLRQYCADPAAMGKGLRVLLGLALLADSESSLAAQAAALQNFATAAIGPEADSGRIIRLLAMLGGGTDVEKFHQLVALLGEDRGELLGKANAASLQKLALLLELQDELNALPVSTRQAQFLLFPCAFVMGAGVGQWLFSLDRGEDQTVTGEDRGYTLSFFLEMSRLGEIQIQLRAKGKTLQGECVVSNEAVREHLAPQLVELEELLGKLGYESVHFFCRVARVSMLESLKVGLETAAQLGNVRIVDLTA